MTVKESKAVEDPKTTAIKLDTPQQDKEWTAEEKTEWVKASTRKVLSAFNSHEKA